MTRENHGTPPPPSSAQGCADDAGAGTRAGEGVIDNRLLQPRGGEVRRAGFSRRRKTRGKREEGRDGGGGRGGHRPIRAEEEVGGKRRSGDVGRATPPLRRSPVAAVAPAAAAAFSLWSPSPPHLRPSGRAVGTLERAGDAGSGASCGARAPRLGRGLPGGARAAGTATAAPGALSEPLAAARGAGRGSSRGKGLKGVWP